MRIDLKIIRYLFKTKVNKIKIRKKKCSKLDKRIEKIKDRQKNAEQKLQNNSSWFIESIDDKKPSKQPDFT